MDEKIINIENMRKKELEVLKENYMDVKMPEEQLEQLKVTIEKGKRENRRERQKRAWTRLTVSAAAVMAAIIILPNTSPSVAYAMEKVPLLGGLVRLVTWRDYEYEDERHQAEVKVEKLEFAMADENGSEEEISMNTETLDSSNTKELEKSMGEINAQIEEITNQLMAEFESHMQEEMGYQDLVVKSEVVTNNEEYFTLRLLCYQGAGSGYEWNYFYTIDLATGERLQLKNLFVEDADYITLISDDIKRQMREQMEADENVYYWLDDEMEEWNFKSITEETSFYINEEGKLVINFNEGDVAPMYMGVVEFVIEEEIIGDILK